jgi:hypothetical protein
LRICKVLEVLNGKTLTRTQSIHPLASWMRRSRKPAIAPPRNISAHSGRLAASLPLNNFQKDREFKKQPRKMKRAASGPLFFVPDDGELSHRAQLGLCLHGLKPAGYGQVAARLIAGCGFRGGG